MKAGPASEASFLHQPETPATFDGMGEMRKITVSLPAELVEASLHTSGKGITETIREALAARNHAWACERLLELRGKIDLRIDLEALRDDD